MKKIELSIWSNVRAKNRFNSNIQLSILEMIISNVPLLDLAKNLLR